MSPRTRSNKMGEQHLEVVERGVSTSNPRPEGDLMSMMAQMMVDLKADLRHDIKGLDDRMKESEIRRQSTQNTLFEEITALKGSRPSRSPTPRDDPIPNFVPEENIGEGGYEGWHGMDEHGGYVRNRGGNMENGRFGMGNGVHGHFGMGNGANGHFGMRNPHGRVELYEDYKFYEGYSRGECDKGDYESRYHEDGLDR